MYILYIYTYIHVYIIYIHMIMYYIYICSQPISSMGHSLVDTVQCSPSPFLQRCSLARTALHASGRLPSHASEWAQNCPKAWSLMGIISI